MRSASLLLLTLVSSLAAPALASDGVAEINQTCAVQTGCFPGDTAGLPVTIDGSAGTSYRLTSDLVVPDDATDGIEINADDVGIDLNNFTISGPVVCTSDPVNCTLGQGTGVGVRAAGVTGTSVRDGSIRGMGGRGVAVGNQSEVIHLRVQSNRSTGIFAGVGSTVTGNTVYLNGGPGINPSSGTTISGNTAYRNGNYGIFANFGSTVTGNTSYGNEGGGIGGADGVAIVGNASFDNGLRPSDDGIQCGSGCLVRDNAVRNNAGRGLSLGSNSAYGANVITGNANGTVAGGFNILLNVCDGPSAPQCP